VKNFFRSFAVLRMTKRNICPTWQSEIHARHGKEKYMPDIAKRKIQINTAG